MKRDWPRPIPALALSAVEAAELLRPVRPDAHVERVALLAGGLANSNLRVDFAGADAPLVLRLYQRAPAQAAKEVALHRLVGARVPVAEALHWAESNPVTGGPYAVMRFVEGELMDEVAPGLDAAALADLAETVGRVLADVHGFRFPVHGFLGPDLAIPEAIDVGARGMIRYLRACLLGGPGGARLGADLTRRLLAFVESRADLLDQWQDPPSLVHADFNGPNILVRRDLRGRWRVAAVLDWEFALSATPAMDFGNLLRFPYGDAERYAAALAAGYRAAGGSLPEEWRQIAALADFTAWADFLARPHCSPAFLADARAAVERTLEEP